MNHIPFDSDQWVIDAVDSRVEEYLGQQSLMLKGGTAILPDVNFTNGIIEYDVAFGPVRAFVGAMWRIQDAANFEKFYLRAHQSGNPDASQYTPLANGMTGWQLYPGPNYSATVDHTFDEWTPVRVVVCGSEAEVYIGDMETPIVFIPDLKHDIVAGGIGVEIEPIPPLQSAHFANFRYEAIDNPELKGTVAAPIKTHPGTLRDWEVATTLFPKPSPVHLLKLSAEETEPLAWTPLRSDGNGVANLGMVHGITDAPNTAVARTTVHSDTDQVKPLGFGYSDSAEVYLNGQLIYSGYDVYSSRDYRFLGTMGYFYTLYLPLKAGENEIMFVVTEFSPPGAPPFPGAGWGFQARFQDLDGLSISS